MRPPSVSREDDVLGARYVSVSIRQAEKKSDPVWPIYDPCFGGSHGDTQGKNGVDVDERWSACGKPRGASQGRIL
jgi:hypothetical protein